MPDRVTQAVKEAQTILARYCQNTINDLLTVLDDERLVEAMEEEHERQSHQTGPARP
jgi:transcriptional regulatory protein LevR